MESAHEENARLKRKVEELEAEITRLRQLLEEALRAGKRQAAPFSRRHPKAHPKKPGRKPGKQYGRRCRRKLPQKIDQIIEVSLPGQCPRCGDRPEPSEVVSQYQTEIPPPRIETIEFRIHVGRCRNCGARVQGRHERQTSDALGGAASQLGPRAISLATQLNKGLGLPYGKTAAVLEQAFGLRVSRGGLCQALRRLGQRAAPSYRALVERIRGEPSVTPDETGWKVGGRLWWMWVFVSPLLTVYAIQPGRGFRQAAAILGEDFAGFLVRDGWVVYRQFLQAMHQSCLAHLLRRCREMVQTYGGGRTSLPALVTAILQAALSLRQRRDQKQIGARGLAMACGRLEARLDRVLERRWRSEANRRMVAHLWRERQAILTFLYCPGMEATNWRAEQAIRPMVVTRKVWGGNRTARGAETQSILLSILQTCRQQNRPALPLLERLLCSPRPQVLRLAAPRR